MKIVNFKDPGTLMVFIGNVLAIIGCFMPFISFWGVTVNYIEGDGRIVLVLSIISIVLAFFKTKIAFIPNILSLIVCFVDISALESFSLDFLGTGAYVIIIACIVSIIGSIISKKAQ